MQFPYVEKKSTRWRRRNQLDYLEKNATPRQFRRQETVTNQTSVSLCIAKHLFSKQSNDNLVFSPLSLQVVLSLIAAGTEGPTQQQLLNFLRSESTDNLNSFVSHLLSVVLTDAAPSGGPRLAFVDGAWVEKTISLQPSFKEVLTTDYKATLSSVDFQNKAVEVIDDVNLWAEKETNGLIKEILSPGSVNYLTRLIFANALYFKGAWDQPFDPSETKDYDFYIHSGSSVKVPFMTCKKDQFIRAFDGFKVLCLPYEQGGDKRRFSMYFFLPNAKDGLPALVEKVASESTLLHHKICHSKVKVGDFRIPRFNISFGLETSNMLKELGVVLPFSSGSLTKMVDYPNQDLYVYHIFHKSFIEVNEEGTEAAAATCAVMNTEGVTPRLDFVADHPFLFLIREDLSGTILFIGQMLNPLLG